MTHIYKYSLHNTPLGIITMTSDGTSILSLRVNCSECTDDVELIGPFKQTIEWLYEYFEGEIPHKHLPLAPAGTPFQKLVWAELLKIPYGQTTTYGAIAKVIGCRSAQAVGRAIGANPIHVIVPCHRVIGADGSLTGFAAGIDIKRKLLDMEQRITESRFDNKS